MRNFITNYIFNKDGSIQKCIANDGKEYNDLSAKEYNVAPVMSDTKPGAVASGTKIALSCSTSGATIFYTQDGTKPSMASTRYSGKITISSAKTIKAIAYLDGAKASEVQAFEYTIAE